MALMGMGRTGLAFLAAALLLAPVAARPPQRPAAPKPAPEVLPAPDRLFDAQQGLIDKAVATLQPRVPGHANLYALAIAAGGRQQLFGREAHLALQVAQARYGADYRGGLLLSNAIADLLRAPLATRGNTILALAGIAPHIDPAQDVAFLYLASHGSHDATLETDLANDGGLSPISATSVANALAVAGVHRRIIVISACFSGSWIPALADDDTIIITAARADRTSFGCDDTRQLTFFGEAFLQGPLAQGASLHEAFAAAQSSVAKWEAQGRLLPSQPQAYVGANMRAVWEERGTPAPAPVIAARAR